jgi:hypothetical protein
MTDDATPRAAPTARLPSAIWPLAVLAVIFLAFFFRAAPLALDPVRAVNGEAQFDAPRAIERLARILGDQTPHPVDSDALDAARARLLAEIEALGYAPDVHDQTACRGSISGSAIRCARVQNITFAAGPDNAAPDAPVTVLTAHYDSVDAAPGAGDDGVGVAVWLEVAHHFRQSPPPSPILFLLTDGEETALLGAQAFVDAKAYGRTVGRIINLEARGVRGPAMMFETSHPNADIVKAWSKAPARPVSNSLMTAIYELLPNSTDLTVYLQVGWPGVNIAIADGLDFYHSQRDDLSMLDHRSVQHMGDQALGAARAFADAALNSPVARGEAAYADIATRAFIMLPQFLALVLLGLCFGVAAMLVLRPARVWDWRQFDWRAFILPPALVLASGGLAFAVQFLIALVRPEPAFWIAHPQALNCAIFLAALMLAAAGLAWLAPRSRREALFASGWFWFLVVGVGLSFAVPGVSIIFLLPGLVFVVAAAVARWAPRHLVIAHAVAAAFLALVFFPLIHLFDVMMGLGLAALFGVLEGLVLAPMLAVVGPIANRRIIPVALPAAGLLAAAVAAAILPAFSVDRPLALNFTAHYDADARQAQLVAGGPPEALPSAVRDLLSVEAADILPGVSVPLASKPLAFTPPDAPQLAVVSDETAGETRTLRLRLAADDARIIRLRIPASARPASFQHAGAPAPLAMKQAQNGYFIIDCVGRACDGAEYTLTFAAAPSATPGETPDAAPDASGDQPRPWIVQGYWSGLPSEADSVAAARPDTALQVHAGDVTIVTTRAAP